MTTAQHGAHVLGRFVCSVLDCIFQQTSWSDRPPDRRPLNYVEDRRRHLNVDLLPSRSNGSRQKLRPRFVSTDKKVLLFRHSLSNEDHIPETKCILSGTANILPSGNISLKRLQIQQVYLLTQMECATLLHVKSTISHCPSSWITRQRASLDSKQLYTPKNVGYYHISQTPLGRFVVYMLYSQICNKSNRWSLGLK